MIRQKKKVYPLSDLFLDYLKKYNRILLEPLCYEDLKRFTNHVPLLDDNDNDTLWWRVMYDQNDESEIFESMKRIYFILYYGGDTGDHNVNDHLVVDSIDFCTFGNTQPFRIKIRNVANDNYTHFYVKRTDASRVYGLELEHILSPNRINFFVHEDTLVEEHIAGIPGDIFAENYLGLMIEQDKNALAKEYVKFNERCIIRLLGDMRAYNYVVVPTHDFDSIQYRIRSIDFDQQSYEGSIQTYMPKFFKENHPYISLVSERLDESSVLQYKKEERSMISRRMRAEWYRLTELVEKTMQKDHIAPAENINVLKKSVATYANEERALKCNNMGELLEVILRNLVFDKYYTD